MFLCREITGQKRAVVINVLRPFM